jgi:ATP-dependent Clp protease ATP-binding subunit ClpC
MNDSTQLQLRIIVERAVRPVRASMSRKRKMREELLAHVSAVFEEEEARLGDEQAALEWTAQRFGNPAELTGQLQASVPTSDFLQRFLEGMALRTDESMLRRAVRFAVVMFFVCVVFLLPPLSVQRRVYYEWSLIMAFAITVFYFAIHSDLMRQALGLDGATGRLWRRATVVAAASSFLISGVTIGLVLTLSGDVRSSLTDVLPLLPATVLTPVAFVVPVNCFAVELRSHREWMSLQIN